MAYTDQDSLNREPSPGGLIFLSGKSSKALPEGAQPSDLGQYQVYACSAHKQERAWKVANDTTLVYVASL